MRRRTPPSSCFRLPSSPAEADGDARKAQRDGLRSRRGLRCGACGNLGFGIQCLLQGCRDALLRIAIGCKVTGCQCGLAGLDGGVGLVQGCLEISLGVRAPRSYRRCRIHRGLAVVVRIAGRGTGVTTEELLERLVQGGREAHLVTERHQYALQGGVGRLARGLQVNGLDVQDAAAHRAG